MESSRGGGSPRKNRGIKPKPSSRMRENFTVGGKREIDEEKMMSWQRKRKGEVQKTGMNKNLGETTDEKQHTSGSIKKKGER